ncbi:ABC transporter permease [Rhodoplanes roseus]|uniref:ABC transporter permease n=1 Tax=Rhodoplanes roseus TaxID=29409 RepID=A0A327L909_9BRAD|nr:ABC transporter permease subunit [Rhodoplanes roseus]RAI46002.1 ABC transporter permease [Rhodoplanes roseus]
MPMVVARGAWGLLGLAGLGLAWQLGHDALGPFVLPSPAETVERLWALIVTGQAGPALAVTGVNAIGGFLVGALLGAALGVTAGLLTPLGATLRPVLTVMLGVPPIAWVVLALLWFGPRGLAPAFTVSITVLPIVFSAAFQGILARDQKLSEMARVVGASPLLSFRMLLLPQLLDPLLPALATALAFSWKVGVMAEVLGGGTGIGGMIATERAHLDLAGTMAWILLVVALLLVCDGLLLAPMRRFLRTRRPAPAAG